MRPAPIAQYTRLRAIGVGGYMRGKILALRGAFALAVLAGLGTQAGAARAPISILVKPSGSYDARTADIARCHKIAHDANDSDLPQGDMPIGYAMPSGAAGGGVPSVAGAAIAFLIIGLIEENEAVGRGEELCMHNLGYRLVPLTPEEAHVYSKMTSSSQKIDWQRKFLESDLSARLEAVNPPPLVPRLPEYRDGPMRSGGLQFDGLTLTAPEVKEGQDVLTGTATRWRTAVLVTPIETKEGAVRVAADPGTVFHQVDYRRQRDPLLRLDGATWCGPVRQLSNGNSAKDFYCFTGRENGYEVFRPSGKPWLAGPYTGGFMLPLYDQPIKLEERAQDDLGPLDFRIKLMEATSRHVRLAAEVIHDDKHVTLWLRDFSWDKTGKAVLPLWDKRLVLTRGAKDSVKAEVTADGDGHDWRAGDLIY